MIFFSRTMVLVLVLLLGLNQVWADEDYADSQSSYTQDGIRYVDLNMTFGADDGEFIGSNGNTTNTLYAGWKSKNRTPEVTITARNDANDIVRNLRNADGKLELTVGLTSKGKYRIALPEGYILSKVTLKVIAQGADNLALQYGDNDPVSISRTEQTEFVIMNTANTNYVDFVMTGSNDESGNGAINVGGTNLHAHTIPQIGLNFHLTKHVSGQTVTSMTYVSQNTVISDFASYLPTDMQAGFVSYSFYEDAEKTKPIGSSYTATATQEMEEKQNYTKNIYVDYTVNTLPAGFTYADNTKLTPVESDEINWRYWIVNGSTQGKYPVYVNGSDMSISATAPSYGEEGLDNYLFAFYGDPFETVVINKAKGISQYLSGNGTNSSLILPQWTSEAYNEPYTISTDQYGTKTYSNISTSITTWKLMKNTILDSANPYYTLSLNNTNKDIYLIYDSQAIKQGNYSNLKSSTEPGVMVTNNGVVRAMSLSNTKPQAKVVYNIYNELGDLDYSYSTTADLNTAYVLPEAAKRGYCTYTMDEGTVFDGENVVNVFYTYDGPIVFSNAENPQYSYLTFTYLNSRSTNSVASSESRLLADVPTSREDTKTRWAFFGNPYSVKMVNEAKGTSTYVGVPTDKTLAYSSGTDLIYSEDDTRTTWELFNYNNTAFTLRLKGESVQTFFNCQSSTKGKGSFGYYSVNATITNGVTNAFNNTAPLALKQLVDYVVVNGEGKVVAKSELTLTTSGTTAVLPNDLKRGYCIYSLDTDVITSETETVTASYSVNESELPFEFSPDEDHLQYYLLTITNTYDPNRTQISSTQADKTKAGIGTRLIENATSQEYMFAFVGDPYCMKVYNKNTGKDNPLSVSATDYSTFINLGYDTANDNSKQWPMFSTGKYNTFDLFKSGNVSGGDDNKNGFVLRLKGDDLTSTDLYLWKNGYVGIAKKSATYGDGIVTLKSGDNAMFKTYVGRSLSYEVLRKDGKTTDIYDNITVGDAPYLPTVNRTAFCTYNYFTTSDRDVEMEAIDPTNTTTVYVTEIEEYPFEVSDPSKDVNEWHWYYMGIRNGDNYVAAEGPGPYPARNTNDYGPLGLWAFVGNINDGFEIYNRWYGKDYKLSNPYGANPKHDVKMGPVMMDDAYAAKVNATQKWNLVQYNDKLFGFEIKAEGVEPMSINVHTSTASVGFFKDNAKYAMNSRLKVEPYLQKASDDATSDDVKAALVTEWQYIGNADKIGDVFCLNETVVDDAGTKYTTADIIPSEESASFLEQIVTNPANYVMPTNGYYRFINIGQRIAGDTKAYAQITSSDYVRESLNADVNVNLSIDETQTAGSIFKATFDDHSHSLLTLSSQGLNVVYNDEGKTTDSNRTLSAKSSGDAYQMICMPMGNGRFMFATNATPTDDPNSHAVILKNGKIAIGSYYNFQTHTDNNYAYWYAEPVKTYETSALLVNNPEDFYDGYTFSYLYVDFPVEVTTGTAFYCENGDDETVSFTKAPKNQVPAGVPFIVRGNLNGSKKVEMKILDAVSWTSSEVSPVFKGSFLATKYNDVNPIYDNVRIMGTNKNDMHVVDKTEDEAEITSDKTSTGVAFRKASNHTNVAANRPYLDLSATKNQTRALRIKFLNSDIEPSTSVESIPTKQIINDNKFYDLMGRVVEHPTRGIYIHNGRKVVIK